MSDDRDGVERQVPFRERLRQTAIYAAWAAAAIGFIWLLFNLPPPVANFLRAVFRLLSLFN
jgi:hypothetical protein